MIHLDAVKNLLKKDGSYQCKDLVDFIINSGVKRRQREAYENGALIYYHQGVTDTLKSMQPDLNTCTFLSEEERKELYDLLNRLKIRFYYIEPTSFIPKGCNPGLNILKNNNILDK